MKEFDGTIEFVKGYVFGYTQGWKDGRNSVKIPLQEPPKVCPLCGTLHSLLHEFFCCHPKCPYNIP